MKTGYISGYKVYPNQTGIQGWNITLYNQTGGNVLYAWQLTGSDGSYNFTGLPYGVTFNVSEVIPAGWTPLGSTYYNGLNIDGGLSHVNKNFTNEKKTGYISGYKIQNETGLGVPGWTVEARNQSDGSLVNSAITDGTGFYNITGLPYGGTYNISEVEQPGWIPVSDVFVPDLPLDEQNPFHININFTNDPPAGTAAVSGFKYCQDCTELGCGLPGWTISLLYPNGTVFDSVITGFGGSYEFNDVPYGTYWLNETIQEGWTQVTPNVKVILDQANQSYSYDFINKETTYCCNCIPPVTFTYAKKGATVTFTDTTPGLGPQRYIWSFGDRTISTQKYPIKTYSKPGTYTVTMYSYYAYCDSGTPIWKSSTRRITVP
jgi:hypothetical protein